MLITFKSKNSGEVFMLDKHALAVLKVAGRDYEELPEEGTFTSEQLVDAIAKLRQAIEEDENKDMHSYAVHDKEEEERKEEEQEKKHPMLEGVSFSQRAYPLLTMFENAQKHGDAVIWQSGKGW